MSPDVILARIKARHGAGFTLTGSYAGGESGHGAFRVEDESGKPWVLKLGGDSHSGRASRVTAILRERDYPAPLYRFYGSVDGFHFSVQEQMPGTSIEIRTEHVTQLIRLNATQQDVAPDRFGEWRDHMGESVLAGFRDYCVLEPLRKYSEETAAILVELQSIVSSNLNQVPERNDIVHYDLNPSNILADEDRITGIVDWESVQTGDCAFDLTTLLFYLYSSEVPRHELWRQVIPRSGASAIKVYLAHLIVRQIDWSIRHHDGPTVELYLDATRCVMRDIREL